MYVGFQTADLGKEIRLMPQAEQGRFVAAVKKLMENKELWVRGLGFRVSYLEFRVEGLGV